MINQLDLFLPNDNLYEDLEYRDISEIAIDFGEGTLKKEDLKRTNNFLSSIPRGKYFIYKGGSKHRLEKYGDQDDFPFIITSEGKKLTFNYSRDVYPAVVFTDKGISKSYKVHRLVAMAFLYNPKPFDNFLVDHINEDKHDYRPSNLRWVSPSENQKNIKDTDVFKIIGFVNQQ
jgi:hypothetical protein